MNLRTLTDNELLSHARNSESAFTPMQTELRLRLEQALDRAENCIPENITEKIDEDQAIKLLERVAFYANRISPNEIYEMLGVLSDNDITDVQYLIKVIQTAKAMLAFRAECASGLRDLIEYFDNHTPIEL